MSVLLFYGLVRVTVQEKVTKDTFIHRCFRGKSRSDLIFPRKEEGKTASQPPENANRTQECRATYSTWLLLSPKGISTLLLLCLPLVEREG